MESLKRKALRNVPSRDISEIPTDVIQDILREYFKPAWIITIRNPDRDFNDRDIFGVYQAQDKYEATKMFIIDFLDKYPEDYILTSHLFKRVSANAFRSGYYFADDYPDIWQELMDADSEEQYDDVKRIILSNLDLISRYFVDNITTSQDFNIKPFKYNKLY